MVVCKFFLQGTCKFGNSCKFEHQINDSTNAHSVSIMRQNPPTNTGSVPDVNALVRSVQTDMLNTEKGGQWLLSSYAPFKEKPAFPGFEDKSFEEIRLGFYEATKNGSVEQYKQQLQGFLQEAVIKIRTLQNPSQEIVTLLKQIYNTPLNPAANAFAGQTVFANQTSATNNQSVFSVQAKPAASIFAPSLFSPTNANSSPFNTPTAATAPFTQQAAVSPFNQQAATSPFNQQAATSPFSAKTTNSPFNTQATTNSPFAAGTFVNQGNFSTQASSLPFAQVPAQFTQFSQVQNPSPFTQAQSQAQNSSPFTQAQNQSANPSPFTQAQNSSPFTQAQPQVQNPSPFTLPQIQAQTVSPFAQVQTQAQSSAPFSQAQAPTPSPFAQVQSQAPQSTSPFVQAQSQAPQSTSPFVQAQSHAQNPSPFASVMQKPATFANPSPFSNQAAPALTSQSNSPFASIVAQNTQSTQPSSVFETTQNTVVSVFGGQPAASGNKDSSLYSKESDLTKGELEAFRNDAFEMGSIPDKPPPFELCF